MSTLKAIGLTLLVIFIIGLLIATWYIVVGLLFITLLFFTIRGIIEISKD